MSEEVMAADGLLRENAQLRAERAALLAELALLRELASDVARWRETGGDPRDLRYILETADRIAQMKAGSA